MGAPQTFRQRYIAFRTSDDLSKEELENFFGNLNLETSFSYTPWIVRYNKKSGEGLLKCSHLQVDDLKSEIKKHDRNNISVLGVSGTIKKARKKFLSI